MSKTIATITKNSMDEVRVSLSEFKGHTYVDVRVYTEFEGDSEVWRLGQVLAKGECHLRL